MKLFHEIYNRYMILIAEMLRKSQSPEGISRDEIRRLVSEKGFFYDNIQFENGIIEQSRRSGSIRDVRMDNLYLFVQEEGGYTTPFTKAGERILPTVLEKRWLKTVLTDPRVKLFLSPVLLRELEQWLMGIAPLYDFADVLFRNYRMNGDPYDDPSYVEHFRTILSGIQQRQQLLIVNRTSNGRCIDSIVSPYRLEYSLKDDVFRICGGVAEKDGDNKLVSMRLSRIQQVTLTGQAAQEDHYDNLIEDRRSTETARLQIENNRNGYERFLHFFSNYARMAKYNEESRKLLVELEYYDFDENELIVSILAMGPILKVIGPDQLRSKVVQRLRRQLERNF